MQHDAGTLAAADGLTLATRRWTPRERPKAVVLIVHGIAEHSGRYAHLATHLLLHGYAALAYDHRAHGRSEGEPRTHVESFGELVDDLRVAAGWAREEAEGRPLFVFGHSLGGSVAARYVVEHGTDGLAGLILSSPALKIPPDLSPLLQKVAGLLNRVAPRLRTAKLDLGHLSRDPAVARAYRADPLTDSGGIRARMGYEILRATDGLLGRADAFTLPLLLLHGTADRITDPGGTQALYDAAPTADKTLELYEGFYHETFNEPERERVLDDIADWLDARAPAS